MVLSDDPEQHQIDFLFSFSIFLVDGNKEGRGNAPLPIGVLATGIHGRQEFKIPSSAVRA